MPTVTGTLQTILNETADIGSVEIALCGYGSQVPRLPGAMGACVMDGTVAVDDDGGFSFTVAGNDQITPSGTYYTVTIRNENGDITQVNAYNFNSAIGSYDLDTLDPFDPSNTSPPGIPPPPPVNQLDTVPFDPAAVFEGDEYTAWAMTLSGDTAPTFTNLVDGNLYTLILFQDTVGGWTVLWPGNVFNAQPPSPNANSMSVQTFIAMNGDLYPIAPGTYYP